MCEPLVSVLMSVRNGLPYLEQAVRSILAQTFTGWEFVILDNASSDDSAGLIEKFAAQEPRIRFFRNAEDLGQSGALNRGLAHCRGKWIARIDADDVALPNRFERQLAFLRDNPDVKVTSCLAYYINEEGKRVGKTFHDLSTREAYRRYVRENRNIGILHPGAMIDRQLLIDAGGYRQDFFPANDIDLWGRIADRGALILVQQEILMEYRIHGGSSTARDFERSRVKCQWARACMVARRERRPEPSWDEYVAMREHAPLWKRLDRWRKTTGRRLYRTSGQHIVSHRALRAIASIAGAMLLEPAYTFIRLKGQILK